jgi:hypothetical protein
MAKYPDSAFYNLFRLATKMKFYDLNRLLIDTDLEPLRSDLRWPTLCNIVQKNKDTAEVNFIKPVVLQLDSIYIEDQKYRIQLDELEKIPTKSDKQKAREQDSIWRIIALKDASNLIKVKAIIDKYGWLGPNEIGDQGSSTLFLVIQHSDQITQEKYLPLMRAAVKNGKARPAELALLEDRVAIGQGKKQIYGSQLIGDNKTGQYTLSPIEDEINVNKRRAEVGLQPIEEYVKQWGIEYKAPSFEKYDTEMKFMNSLVPICIAIFSLISLSILIFIWYKIKRRKRQGMN